MATQLILPIRPHDDASFASFFPGKNKTILNYLSAFAVGKSSDHVAYLWGVAGVGCSHLLQACCDMANQQSLSAIYLSLAEINSLSSTVFENLESFNLICLDDIHLIAENFLWEEALFHLYNRVQVAQGYLLMAANIAPAGLAIRLPDLASRLAGSTIFQVHELADNEKLMALQLRAKLRGLELADDVAQFLLRRYPRDFPSLFSALEKLDESSLAEQRRLTIPFVKQVLG